MIKIFESKIWALIVSPFSLLYKWVMQFRNYLYNIEYKPSFDFDNLIISIGNLSVGGTGKTPMVEFLIRFLTDKDGRLNTTVLSRGYGRKSKGFFMADENSTAKKIGDEPYQIYRKFKDQIGVAVCEDRVLAVPSIILERAENKIIILDDAYQHRSIKADLSIVLSDVNRPFYEDYVLPSGLLREGRKGIERADVLIFTKCANDMPIQKRNEVREKASKYFKKPYILFSGIKYANLLPADNIPCRRNIVLLTGIANPQTMIDYLEKDYNIIKHFKFGDHHNFSQKELKDIDAFAAENKADIVTTEKDWVRVESDPRLKELITSKLFYLPIVVYFLEGQTELETILEGQLKHHNLIR